MRVEIIIKADIQPFAQNACNRDWRIQHSSNEKAKRLGRKAWRDAGSPTFDRQVRISVLIRRTRRIDELNIPGACKHFLDGFCRGRKISKDKTTKKMVSQRIPSMIPDDNTKWARWGTFEQEIKPYYEEAEEIVFIVEPIGEAMIWDRVPDTQGAANGEAIEDHRGR